eukprot:3600599-Rhodomonas_salina.1
MLGRGPCAPQRPSSSAHADAASNWIARTVRCDAEPAAAAAEAAVVADGAGRVGERGRRCRAWRRRATPPSTLSSREMCPAASCQCTPRARLSVSDSRLRSSPQHATGCTLQPGPNSFLGNALLHVPGASLQVLTTQVDLLGAEQCNLNSS